MAEQYKVVAIHYWQDVKRKIDDLMDYPPTISVGIHNSAEPKELLKFVKKLPKARRILYISLTKTYRSLYPHIKNDRRFRVVDCVSPSVFGESHPPKGCVYMEMPLSIQELGSMITKAVKNEKADIVVLDSLTQFVDFSQKAMTPEVYNLFNKLKERSRRSIKFFLLYDDKRKGLRELPTYQADMIIRMQVETDKIQWWK